MKYILLMLLALFSSSTFTSCTPTEMAERVDLSPTEGEDGDVIPDPDEDEDEG